MSHNILHPLRKLIDDNKIHESINLIDKINKEEIDEVTQCKLEIIEYEILILLGEYDFILQRYKSTLSKIKELNLYEELIKIHLQVANSYRLTGNLQNSLLHCEKALNILNEHEITNIETYNFLLGEALRVRGLYNFTLGYFNIGQNDFELAINYFKKINNEKMIAVSYDNLGYYYREQGRPEISLNYHFKAYPILKKLEVKHDLAICLENIALTHRMIGDFDTSKNFFNEALSIRKEISNKYYLAWSLFNYILLMLDMDNMQVVEIYQEQLKDIAESIQNPMTLLRSKLIEALFYKKKNSIKYLYYSYSLLKEIIQQEKFNIEILSLAIFNLCEILILDISKFGNMESLSELTKVIELLEEKSTETNSYRILVQTLIVKSKILTLNNDVNAAETMLNQALTICENQKMNLLGVKLNEEYDSFLEEVKSKKIKPDIEEQSNLTFDLVDNLNNLIHDLGSNRYSKIEMPDKEMPILFYLIYNTVPIYKFQFTSSKLYQEELVSNFLAAIYSFGNEIFQQDSGNTHQRFKQGNHTIIMEKLNLKTIKSSDILIAYIFVGPSYHAIQKIKQVLDEISSDKDIVDKLNNLDFRNQQQFDDYYLDNMDEIMNKIFL